MFVRKMLYFYFKIFISTKWF